MFKQNQEFLTKNPAESYCEHEISFTKYKGFPLDCSLFPLEKDTFVLYNSSFIAFIKDSRAEVYSFIDEHDLRGLIPSEITIDLFKKSSISVKHEFKLVYINLDFFLLQSNTMIGLFNIKEFDLSALWLENNFFSLSQMIVSRQVCLYIQGTVDSLELGTLNL